MTSREFISKWYAVNDDKDRWLSSIYKDRKGNIYSYGHHYPLMFTVAGYTFINKGGYSSTTGKHIGWAWAAADYDAIGVELSGCNQYSYNNSENARKVPFMLKSRAWDYSDAPTDKQLLKAIIADLKTEAVGIAEQMSAKKRKNTAIYEMLDNDLQKAQANIRKCVGILEDV